VQIWRCLFEYSSCIYEANLLYEQSVQMLSKPEDRAKGPTQVPKSPAQGTSEGAFRRAARQPVDVQEKDPSDPGVRMPAKCEFDLCKYCQHQPTSVDTADRKSDFLGIVDQARLRALARMDLWTEWESCYAGGSFCHASS
jgi:hypothetical protein